MKKRITPQSIRYAFEGYRKVKPLSEKPISEFDRQQKLLELSARQKGKIFFNYEEVVQELNRITKLYKYIRILSRRMKPNYKIYFNYETGRHKCKKNSYKFHFPKCKKYGYYNH